MQCTSQKNIHTYVHTYIHTNRVDTYNVLYTRNENEIIGCFEHIHTYIHTYTVDNLPQPKLNKAMQMSGRLRCCRY